jgi:hypothetical protein
MARARPRAIPLSLAFSAIAFFSVLSVVASCQTAPRAAPSSLSPTAVAASSSAPTTPALLPTATSTPTVVGSASPSPAAGVQPLPFGKLAAGTYRPVSFGIPLTFTVAGGMDGWAAAVDERGIVELHAQRNAIDQFVLALPTSFGQAGKGLFESLSGQIGDIGSIRSTTVDGYPGREADFVVPSTTGTGLNVFSGDGGTWFATSGNHLLVVQVDLGDAIFVILVEAPTSEWPVIAPLAEGVIDSIDFE